VNQGPYGQQISTGYPGYGGYVGQGGYGQAVRPYRESLNVSFPVHHDARYGLTTQGAGGQSTYGGGPYGYGQVHQGQYGQTVSPYPVYRAVLAPPLVKNDTKRPIAPVGVSTVLHLGNGRYAILGEDPARQQEITAASPLGYHHVSQGLGGQQIYSSGPYGGGYVGQGGVGYLEAAYRDGVTQGGLTGQTVVTNPVPHVAPVLRELYAGW